MTIKNTLKRTLTAAVIAASTIIPLSEAKEIKQGFAIDLNIYNDFGYGTTTISEPLPENWKDNFEPKTTSLNEKKVKGFYSYQIGIGIEPNFRFENGIRLGFPLRYNLSADIDLLDPEYSIDRNLAGSDTDWWDEVAVTRVRMKETSPAIGLSLQKGNLEIETLFQQYEIYQDNYRGQNNFGGKNSSEVDNSSTLEESVKTRISIYYHDVHMKKDWNSGKEIVDDTRIWGVYYERAGNDTWTAGIAFKAGFNLLGGNRR
ncbi:hypothetical protein H6503_03070 [Candidatus Woesearchaeota archaeon]|nr:hypothetical protein [Candidatus Woesearchaeota archaeon]